MSASASPETILQNRQSGSRLMGPPRLGCAVHLGDVA
jgi:hypothetical protein